MYLVKNDTKKHFIYMLYIFSWYIIINFVR